MILRISRLVRWFAPEDRREGWRLVRGWVYCSGMERTIIFKSFLVTTLLYFTSIGVKTTVRFRRASKGNGLGCISIIFVSWLLLPPHSSADNLSTCLSGNYPSLCKKHLLTPEQARQADAAERAANWETCRSGNYPSLCKKHLLTPDQARQADAAERADNLETCLSGNYPSLCKKHLLTPDQARQADAAERGDNITFPSSNPPVRLNTANQKICSEATKRLIDGTVVWNWDNPQKVRLALMMKIDCAVIAEPIIVESKPKIPDVSDEIKRLEDQVKKLQKEKTEHQSIIAQDIQPPSFRITYSSSTDARGVIKGIAADNSGVAEVRVDGEIVPFDKLGRISVSTFIPPDGKNLRIVVYDLKGLSTTEIVRLERTQRTQQVSRLAAVNPLVGPKQKTSRDRVALIIGLEKYAVAQPAQFASRDAQMFADYAREKLGIPTGNVKVLTDSGAGERNILEALRVWLPQAVKPDTTDLYVFYAGHGMPTADGTSAYLVPYDGDVRFLEDTAISRKRFFDEIGAVRPRSATFFFDNCYSGATRSEELLLASRPLGIKVQETDVPDNYLVFTAGESNQTAGVLDEVKHGRFSYFVFKGLEGEADANSDGKISAGELHTFVRESVGRFSAGAQTPTMLGDGSRWVLR